MRMLEIDTCQDHELSAFRCRHRYVILFEHVSAYKILVYLVFPQHCILPSNSMNCMDFHHTHIVIGIM